MCNVLTEVLSLPTQLSAVYALSVTMEPTVRLATHAAVLLAKMVVLPTLITAPATVNVPLATPAPIVRLNWPVVT